MKERERRRGRERERESHGQYKLAFSAMQRPKSPMQTTIKSISLQNVAASASWHLLLPFYFIFLLALRHPETKLTLSENWRELSLVDSLPSVFLPRTVARLNWSDFRARPFILVSHIWSAAVKWRRSSPRNKLLREVAVLLLLHRHCRNAIGYSMQWVCFCLFFWLINKKQNHFKCTREWNVDAVQPTTCKIVEIYHEQFCFVELKQPNTAKKANGFFCWFNPNHNNLRTFYLTKDNRF